MDELKAVKVIIEYSPEQQRVIVRGVFESGHALPALLAPSHQQNVVNVFLNVDMRWNVGFAGLVPAGDG